MLMSSVSTTLLIAAVIFFLRGSPVTVDHRTKDSSEQLEKLKQEISDLEDEEKQLDLDRTIVCQQIKETTENESNQQYVVL
jgi:hypothetical protein